MFRKDTLKSNARMLLALAVAVIASAPICSHADESASVHVSYSDFNPNNAEGARRLYSRIEAAANAACGTSDMDTDVKVRGGPTRCVRDAIGRAVHDAKIPSLAQVYVQKRGVAEAQKFGVTSDVQTAKN
jgi:UrcA family protein